MDGLLQTGLYVIIWCTIDNNLAILTYRLANNTGISMTNATHNVQDILKKFKSAESSDAVIVLNSKYVYLQITLKVYNYNFSVYKYHVPYESAHTHNCDPGASYIHISQVHWYSNRSCDNLIRKLLIRDGPRITILVMKIRQDNILHILATIEIDTQSIIWATHMWSCYSVQGEYMVNTLKELD